jgi:plastocyanin
VLSRIGRELRVRYGDEEADNAQLEEGIMRAQWSGLAAILIAAGIGSGCGESGPSNTLTTLEVTPTARTLFTVAPGNMDTLSVVAKDQNGLVMSGVGSPSFSSDNAAVATVNSAGIITAVAAGTAQVTVSLTEDGATASAVTVVTVEAAPAEAAVQAPQLAYQPKTVDVSAGGKVTWTFGAIHHTVTFTSAGSPADIPEFTDGSASRTFSSNGTFNYRCSIHTSMTGTVRVH